MKDKIILLSDRAAEYSLYLLIFFLPFSNAGVESCFGIAFLAWIQKRLLGYRVKGLRGLFPATELNKPLLAFILVNTFAVITSVNFISSIRPFFCKVLEYVFIFFIVVDTINTEKRIKNLLAVVIFSALFISADAATQYFRGVDFLFRYPVSGQRLTASFPNPNGFGGWLIVVMFIILGLFLTRQPRKFMPRRLGLGILACVLLLLIGLTYSRGAWIGFLVGLIIVFAYKVFRSSKRVRVLSALLIIVLVIGIFFLLPSAIKGRIESVGTIGGSGLVRLKLWQEALGIIKDFPLFGAGLNTYMAVSLKYSIPGGGNGMSYAHNSYLQMAAETGLAGLVCFLWILVRFFRLEFRALSLRDSPLWGYSLGLLAGISAFLVHSFFDCNLYSLPLVTLFWFMLGLAVSMQRIIFL